MFEPTYTAALTRLNAFLPRAGYEYASQRNYDRPGRPNVSGLSPYLRHRIITEDEVLAATLGRHSVKAAEKFIHEVYWRTYWKGWLEMRPSLWDRYQMDVNAALNRVQTESGLRADWEAACRGDTGIDCFDHWARELVETGYLHNHARMWFASIWIFTLRLPWVLGADFFLRHLLDGDPASNTLSWRWVGGIQTMGKTYMARPDNIAKYTEGRFQPKGLALAAAALESPPHPQAGPSPKGDRLPSGGDVGLLLTEDDLSPGWLLSQVKPTATALFQATAGRSHLHVSTAVKAFTEEALQNSAARYRDQCGPVSRVTDVAAWARDQNVTSIVTSFVPVGPTRDALDHQRVALDALGVKIHHILRPFDAAAWPFATKGFFPFKERIPGFLTTSS